MEAILYEIIFIIGALIGSFCTLAVYRIPLGKDITHERSFCPNCNHRLGFWDLIPIVSYIALGGKCRYCSQKIRIRYLIYEILSGLLFVLLALSMNIHIVDLAVNPSEILTKVIYMIFISLFFISLLLIAGIDKENIEISKPVLIFGMITLGLYIIYLYILKSFNVYRYAIYLIFMLIIIIIDTLLLKKKHISNYTLQTLMLWIYMLSFTNRDVMLFTTIATLLLVAIHTLSHKLESIGKEHKTELKVPIGFYMVIGNIIFIIVNNFINYY